MPRGQPDYGIYTGTPVASGISDPGEAAARLGGINVYDRRGWTVWMDDFEAPGLKWVPSSAGGGIDPILSTARAWHGIQSAYFSAPAAVNPSSVLGLDWPYIRQGKVGIEFWLAGYTQTPGYVRVRFLFCDGVNQGRAEVQVDFEARTVSIVAATGTFVVDTDTFIDIPAMPFQPVKLVIDMDEDIYTRLLVGAREYDISAYSLLNVGPTPFRCIRGEFLLQGDVAADMHCYLDNFILTQNEP